MTAIRERLCGWLQGEQDRQLSFLQSFVRIDSCNPPGDTRAAAELCREFLDSEGIACRTHAPQAAMPNLVGSFQGGRPGRHLVLNGHLDVFPVGDPASWSRNPLSGDIVDGRVHGRGAVDMKCGSTALLFAFAYLHRLRAEVPGRVTLTLVSDEETGGRWGADWLTAEKPDEVLGDCLLNAEPSGLQTVRFGEKSIYWLRFRIRVRGGHSAYPHTGASANRIAAELIRNLAAVEAMPPEEADEVRRILDREDVQQAAEISLGKGAAGVMRRVTMNVGVMQGGVKINMLPSECMLDVDFRLPVGVGRAALLAKVTEIAATHDGATVEELLAGGPEANWSNPEHEMVGHLCRNAGDALGKMPLPIISLGGTDARFWRARGVPAFVYGCSPQGMGAPDESVSIEEFRHVLRTHALAALDYLVTGE